MRALAAAPREERKLLGILLVLGGVACLTLVLFGESVPTIK